MNEETWYPGQGIEDALDSLRGTLQRLNEQVAIAHVDSDGTLSELDAVLQAKRGCRR
jgi:hypothetical protein